eukprot:SM000105S13863  [mRNA]  locus=s105:168661:173853:+ [translate_table: standard]
MSLNHRPATAKEDATANGGGDGGQGGGDGAGATAASALRRASRHPATSLLAALLVITVAFYTVDWMELMATRQKPEGVCGGPGLFADFTPAGATTYRGAPWKHRVGHWLAACYLPDTFVQVDEPLYSKACANNCTGNGVCNLEQGVCDCSVGYKGDDCSEDDIFPCNNEKTEEHPVGSWIVSICATDVCDTKRSHCLCGSKSKYPDRQAVSPCGFSRDPHTGAVLFNVLNHTELFSTDEDTPGWCNVDPKDYYQRRVAPLTTCFCNYDGTAGEFCELPAWSFCLNQCSGRGFCDQGFCRCDEGWYGIDCSTPSALSRRNSTSDPPWLVPFFSVSSSTDIGSSASFLGDIAPAPSRSIPTSAAKRRAVATIDNSGRRLLSYTELLNASVNSQYLVRRQLLLSSAPRTVEVPKLRPLVYVYNIPNDFNAHILQGRQWKFYCSSRTYNHLNETDWNNGWLYGMENAVVEGFLNSPHRTNNPEEADYFFAPLLGACAVIRGDDSPRFDFQKRHKSLRSWFAAEFYLKVYQHISWQYPYWNRTGGRDHIWVFPWDEGACMAPAAIWNGTMLSHWGNTGSKHNESTTAYGYDVWTGIPTELRGNHTCFDPAKDIVLPAFKNPSAFRVDERLWETPLRQRTKLFYFAGNLGHRYQYGRTEKHYSMGIRQKVAKLFASTQDVHGKLGVKSEEGVVVSGVRSPEYAQQLATSRFCGVFPGDGFSARMEDSILHGCIPVIIQDGIQLPYENFLNYSTFTVRIAEDDIPQTIDILKSISEVEVEAMLRTIRGIWQRWSWSSIMNLEAARQAAVGRVPRWAKEMAKLQNDDAMSTLIQILHYKLYNDPWRIQATMGKEDLQEQTNLPSHCHCRT